RSARIGRQNRRRKSDAPSAFAGAVTHAWTPHRDCTDAGHDLALGQMPVAHRRPSSVNLSVWVLSQAATSASTACPHSRLAPLRKTSVSGSENVPGWVSSKTLVSVTRITPSVDEVEALNTPTIRRLTLPCHHQLSALALPRSPLLSSDCLPMSRKEKDRNQRSTRQAEIQRLSKLRSTKEA